MSNILEVVLYFFYTFFSFLWEHRGYIFVIMFLYWMIKISETIKDIQMDVIHIKLLLGEVIPSKKHDDYIDEWEC